MINIQTFQFKEGGEIYYRKIEVDITTEIALAVGLPPNSGLISANDWHLEAFVGAPQMKEDGTMETFEEREATYITQMGWKKLE
jgi:hypothetical protein